MGKQKLTNERVELIKHLVHNKKMSCNGLAPKFNVGRACIVKIKNEQRWNDISTPTEMRGEYLWYKFQNDLMK
jgi:hypothetical protein